MGKDVESFAGPCAPCESSRQVNEGPQMNTTSAVRQR